MVELSRRELIRSLQVREHPEQALEELRKWKKQIPNSKHYRGEKYIILYYNFILCTEKYTKL